MRRTVNEDWIDKMQDGKIDISLSKEDFKNKYGHKKTVGFFTLGCKVNQYDTQTMRQEFEANGYDHVDFDSYADVYVINTCTVTALADRKSRQMIRKAIKHNPKSLVVATGCYAQREPDKVSEIEGVDLIIGTDRRHRVVELVEEHHAKNQPINIVDDIGRVKEFEEMSLSTYKERTRAVLKIQEGCNQFCSYCIIPYVRGRIRSRAPEHIIEEIKGLVKTGIKEFVLTGIHVSCYGEDLDKTSLIELIQHINMINGVERIRLGSLEPKIMTQTFINQLAKCNKVCRQFHLSLQSGCDSVLKRMNRHYTAQDYYDGVKLIRQAMPEAAITTDIIVGFPGETQQEFETTLAFVEKVQFAKVHVFPYSVREGTKAAKMPNQLSGDVKTERAHQLAKVAGVFEKQFVQQFIGKNIDVLFEEAYTDTHMVGYTDTYVRVACKGDRSLQGNIITVKAEQIEENVLMASVVNKNNKQ